MSGPRALDRLDLDAFFATERAAVEAALGRFLDDVVDAGGPALAEPVRYAVEAGGKRLRPILCVAAYRAVTGGRRRGDEAGLYTLAGALELVHTYSLVHDDLPCMDDDDLRRGRPATHKAFGVERATLAGVALIPLAFQAVERGGRALELAGPVRAALARELAAAAGGGGMVGGQLLDLEAEGREIGLEELEAIHRRKTGALLTASLRMGAVAAEADGTMLTALGDYGRSVGLAFQIADDVLDVTATSAALGKTAGKDVAAAKATYPARLGLDGARRRAREEAERAVAAVRRAGLATPELEALAWFAVERDR